MSCADTSFSSGVKLYQSKNYRGALTQFEQALRSNPNDANAMYYLAICQQKSGDNKKAIATYAKLVVSYSYTDAGKYAMSALAALDPKYFRQLTSRFQPNSIPVTTVNKTDSNSINIGNHGRMALEADGISNEADLAKLPSEARIYFQKQGNILSVDGTINNKPTKMIFDTGAEQTSFGKNHLRQLGITPPEGTPSSYSAGVGAGGLQPTWTTRVDIKVGSIERKNFPISVQDEMMCDPLLGQSFFRDFVYTIDNGSNSIHFKRRATPIVILAPVRAATAIVMLFHLPVKVTS